MTILSALLALPVANLVITITSLYDLTTQLFICIIMLLILYVPMHYYHLGFKPGVRLPSLLHYKNLYSSNAKGGVFSFVLFFCLKGMEHVPNIFMSFDKYLFLEVINILV